MADPTQPLEHQVQDMIQAFVLNQLEQTTLARDGKQRTDAGYYEELRILTDKIIKKVYEY